MIKGGTAVHRTPAERKLLAGQNEIGAPIFFSSPTSSSSSSSSTLSSSSSFSSPTSSSSFTPADMRNNCSGKAKARSRNVGVQCSFGEAAEEKQCEECSWKKPQFFKVLVEDFHESLQIPPAFLKHLRVSESGAAIVKDHAGRCWDIKLLRMGDCIIFDEGWKKFVEENELDTYDFLVFRYDGELHFTVTIFNRSCVEKSPATPTADVIADEDHLQSVDVDMEEKCTRTKALDAASSLKTTNSTFKKMVAESDSNRMRIPAGAPNGSVAKKTCQVKLEDPDMDQLQ